MSSEEGESEKIYRIRMISLVPVHSLKHELVEVFQLCWKPLEGFEDLFLRIALLCIGLEFISN